MHEMVERPKGSAAGWPGSTGATVERERRKKRPRSAARRRATGKREGHFHFTDGRKCPLR